MHSIDLQNTLVYTHTHTTNLNALLWYQYTHVYVHTDGAPRNRPLRRLLEAEMEDDRFDDDDVIAEVSAEEEYAERLRMRESRQSQDVNGTPPLLGNSNGEVPSIRETDADGTSSNIDPDGDPQMFVRTQNLLTMQNDTKFSAVSALSFGDMEFHRPHMSIGAETDSATVSSRQSSTASLETSSNAVSLPRASGSAFEGVRSIGVQDAHVNSSEALLPADSPTEMDELYRRRVWDLVEGLQYQHFMYSVMMLPAPPQKI